MKTITLEMLLLTFSAWAYLGQHLIIRLPVCVSVPTGRGASASLGASLSIFSPRLFLSLFPPALQSGALRDMGTRDTALFGSPWSLRTVTSPGRLALCMRPSPRPARLSRRGLMFGVR